MNQDQRKEAAGAQVLSDIPKIELISNAIFKFALLESKKRWPEMSTDGMIAGLGSRNIFAKFILDELEKHG